MGAGTGGSERVVLRRLHTGSVARIALGFWLTLSAVFIVGLIALYLLGLASGAITNFETFMASLGWTEFQLRFFAFFPLIAVLSALFAAVMTALAVLGAVMYNILSDIVGGLEFRSR